MYRYRFIEHTEILMTSKEVSAIKCLTSFPHVLPVPCSPLSLQSFGSVNILLSHPGVPCILPLRYILFPPRLPAVGVGVFKYICFLKQSGRRCLREGRCHGNFTNVTLIEKITEAFFYL